jgi:hypothetical protein
VPTTPTFPAIAACFGTTNLSTILAHLNRGILRATALERVALRRLLPPPPSEWPPKVVKILNYRDTEDAE